MAYARYFSDEGARRYEAKYRRGILRRLSAWRERVCVRRALKAVGASGRVLDLPCGAGRMTRTVAGRASFYVGADLSPAMAFLCANRLLGDGTRACVLVADAARIPAADRSFDGAVTVRLLHHLTADSERRAVVAELCRVSARFVAFSFLDSDSRKQRKRMARAARGGRPARRTCVKRAELAEDLEAADFEVLGYWKVSSLFSGQTVVAAVRKRGG